MSLHATPLKYPEPLRGLGSRVQLDPVFRSNESEPTATQREGRAQLVLLRVPAVAGLGVTDQEVPSQCSINPPPK